MKKVNIKLQVHKWINLAKDDIEWAKHDLKGKFYLKVCFVCQ